MKPSGKTRKCPECGREVTTYLNRFCVEMYAAHNASTYARPDINYFVRQENEALSAQERAADRRCFNSNQPV